MQPILRINLTNWSIDQYNIPNAWQLEYLGGASLAARILYEELTEALDPLSPQAPLIFLNGPLSGTSGPAVGRFVVCAKSPATCLWGEANCGGFWGPELRMAGYDGLWLTGRAEAPVYIQIIDKDVKIIPATHLWGLDTYSTQAAIKAETTVNNLRVAVIGPAGERKIPYASILADHGRMAGRTGMGAVMGSKNLKAIAVKGSGKVPVVHADRYAITRSIANLELKIDGYSQVFRDLGSAGAADYFDYLAEMPKKYFQRGVYEGAAKTTGSSVAESILVGKTACHACVIACGRVVDLGDGIKRKGPEYETLVGFGPNILFDDIRTITQLGELCDLYGFDTISLSNIIGLVMKLYEAGIITQPETGGLVLNWSDPQVVETLIHKTLDQEGIGVWISKGSRELARHFNCEEEAVQVNGLEVPYHDPRGGSGIGLVYATSPRGACHNQSDYFVIDIGQVLESLGIGKYDPHAGAEKARNVAIHQDWRTVFNALVMCVFANVPPETVLELTNAACGLDLSLQELIRIGERGWTIKRAINNRLGLSARNDQLPHAFHVPYQDNPPGVENFVPDFDNMIQEYYSIRGWDPSTGYPTKDKLISLNLGWIAEDIW